MVTKESIIQLLCTNDRALARALVVLYQRQTADEKSNQITRHLNGRGFSAAHAKRGTSMAQFYLRTGFLTPRQLAWWRAPTASGTMRIAAYAGQLKDAADIKAREREAGLQ